MPAYLQPQDAQLALPVCFCSLRGCELYREDELYLIEEQILCTDCLEPFAADYFRHRHFLAAELREFLQL